MSETPDLRDLRDQLDAAEGDAHRLVANLGEAQGQWQPETGSWSVAECLDHLAAANRLYLHAMKEPAFHAREQGKFRRRPAVPGFAGRWFARSMEPPVKTLFKMKAPRSIAPHLAPSLADAFASFLTSQNEVREFLRVNADLDLARVRFPNPFVRGIRFSLATGLHVITAHERRHLCQAWCVRRAAQSTVPELSQGEDSTTKAK